MQINITANGNSNPIALKADDANFKVTVIGLFLGGYNGTYKIQYSPDQINWIDHEVGTNIAANGCNNLFFNVPWMRIVSAGRTAGTLTIHVFGSVA